MMPNQQQTDHVGHQVAMQTAAGAQRFKTILDAVNSLLQDGHTILQLGSNLTFAKPVIWLASEPSLWRMIADDRAAYYCSGTDLLGAYRIGQFDRLGAAVMWIERGH